MKLTDLACRKAQPREKSYRMAAGGGLYLEVLPAGGKYWRWKYRFLDKEKRLAIGVYPRVSLKDAEKKRDEARKLLDDGRDPSVERKAKKIMARIAHANTFESVAREWHATRSHDLVADYAEKILASLEKDVFPALGFRPISEITAPEVLAVLRKVEARGALDTLKRIRQRVSDVFLYAIATSRAASNPVAGLHKAVKVHKGEHRPALQARDLRDFFIRLEVAPISRPVKLALHLLVLTFLRPGELRSARWCELDLDKGEWLVPGERDRSRGMTGMKMGEDHVVPLSRQVVAIFEELKDYSGERDLVFFNRNDHTRPMSDGTLNSALRAMGYGAKEVTGHGFRATATGSLLELGWRPEVIDRQLAHRERRGAVFGAYSHTAQFLQERRKMMQAWADYVDAICTAQNVIPIRAG
ncbi:MAG: tyrosine-type recombinase/integrase [Zoogloeaceae bacterium]|nr:tyrosine-type recombinase/integrase [Zoogloeaceae bacterium]